MINIVKIRDRVLRTTINVLKRMEEATRPVQAKDIKDAGDGNDAAGTRKTKKVALFLMYSGKGYYGMQTQQANKGGQFRTIEGDLFTALGKAKVISESHVTDHWKMQFQRAARTDKGVSAAGQVVSLKINLLVEDAVDKINSYLPPCIRVIDIKRVTKKFDSKNYCNGRTYSYLMPSYALAPSEELTNKDYRITDEIIQKANKNLESFIGTHRFHNFTSQKTFNDPSSRRLIYEFSCGQPFIKNDLEFVVAKVKGQSFMLHQIRKMIGLMIAIMRGLATEETIQKCWDNTKMDIPKAPGLGLMLEKVHYEARYNKRYGEDKVHEALEWEPYEEVINKFKEEQIYPSMIDTEINELSMMNWLSTLPLHSYEDIFTMPRNPYNSIARKIDVMNQNKAEERAADDESSLAAETKEEESRSRAEVIKTKEEESSSTGEDIKQEEEEVQGGEKETEEAGQSLKRSLETDEVTDAKQSRKDFQQMNAN